jgi:hypothetical protein
VEKLAIAAASGPSAGCNVPEDSGCAASDWGCLCTAGVAPCLPIAAPSCQFPPACTGVECQLPNLKVSNDPSDTAAWTGFQGGHSANDVWRFMDRPPTCNAPGTGDPPDEQSVGGDSIDITNGLASSGANNVFNLAKCLWENQMGCGVDENGNITSGPGTVFTIPIFDLGDPSCTDQLNGVRPIVGFATIKITNVIVDGDTKRIDIQTIGSNSGTNPQPGGGCFGTDCRVVLLR